jgi:hypothetical protein
VRTSIVQASRLKCVSLHADGNEEPGLVAGRYIWNNTALAGDWQALGGVYYPSNGLFMNRADYSGSVVCDHSLRC